MADRSLAEFDAWYRQLKTFSGFPARGTIAGTLTVLDRLKAEWDLSVEAHTASGGSQVVGVSGSSIAKILARFGETRAFLSEGGRTNRGLRGDIIGLLEALRAMRLETLSTDDRIAAIERMQEFLVDEIRAWHGKQRIEVEFDDQHTTRDFVSRILDKAKGRGQSGPIAQYLVGAKLQLRFPDLDIDNDSYSTADAQLGRAGDFLVGDTAFHVTVSPSDKVYERCRKNLDAGMSAYLLVPSNHENGTSNMANSIAEGRISVESIESFVGGNVDELARFSRPQVAAQLKALIDTYNKRVEAVEVDKSMLIVLPHNLMPRARKK